MTSSEYQREIEAWRAEMDARLRADESWLTLEGLHWLEPGVSRLGSRPGLEVHLASATAPGLIGVLDLHDGQVKFHADPEAGATVDGKPVTTAVMQPDTAETPTRLHAGSVAIMIIERGARMGVRVWDRNHPARQRFTGRQWFPIEPRFRIVAHFIPYDPPRPLRIVSILGDVEDVPSPGRVSFELDGAVAQLVASEDDHGRLFFNFADGTNGSATYPGGRFLWTSPPEAGKVVVDFNRAYNPPCAFTPYATCPLPIEENHLKSLIEAGERYVEHVAEV